MPRSLAATTSAAALAAVLVGLGFPAAAHAAPATPTGWIRVGHLSPDTPAVDVYLSTFDGTARETIRKAAYGDISPYATLRPGEYTVAMRPAGSDARSPAMLLRTVRVDAGSAATVLAVGTRDQLRNAVVVDDLSAPADGKAKVRLIQGAPSQERVDVVAEGGPVLARDVVYGTATGYAEVPEGRWTLKVAGSSTPGSTAPASGSSSEQAVDARAATVQSLLVLDKPGGGFEVRPVADGSGVPTPPAGGVETGGGGTAAHPAGLGAAGLVVVVIGGVAVLLRRRDLWSR
ncbi:DUF4397 domain-containing protein [Actinokineospora bangkokensis]|uniref:DUF4397 domain-containing protein n=1 Tax=Actinokineospora bangkokensis TaxID=1193682 RepID=A0A1Q9LQX7_9PSEU|nr:DUF4397 domain-containing protein [Actinokineospora bangkokensis]OLR94404.1 hypothetical protein BJP25_11630 [Actinokineospora bangkokensis]